MQQISSSEKEKLAVEAQRGRMVLPSDRAGAKPAPLDAATAEETENEMLRAELEETKSKFDRTLKTNASLRKVNDELKRDVSKMKKIVALEVGDDAEIALASLDDDGNPMSPTTAGPRSASAGQTTKPAPGWKSRAQQIALLKSKSKDLQRQLTASRQQLAEVSPGDFTQGGGDFDSVTVRSGMTGVRSMATGVTGITTASAVTGATQRRDFDDVNRERIERKGQRRLMETREAERAVEIAQEDATKEKSRADALQARMQNLERDNQHLRLCVSRMVEKTENDDALIAEYKVALERQREEMRDAVQQASQQGTNQNIQPKPTVGPSRRESELQREVSKLQDEVAALRRKSVQPTSAPIDSEFAAKGTVPDDGTLLGDAMGLIQTQREAIYSMERQLARNEASAARGRTMGDVPQLVREENSALKERLATMTLVSEREILLYKSAADTFKSEAKRTTPTIGGALPQGRPRRPSSTSSSRPTSTGDAKQELPAPQSSDFAAKEEEVAQLRRQYGELKKAYNKLALQQPSPS